MPVDKFGRNDDRTTTTVYTGINIANLTNSFQGELVVIPLLEIWI